MTSIIRLMLAILVSWLIYIMLTPTGLDRYLIGFAGGVVGSIIIWSRDE